MYKPPPGPPPGWTEHNNNTQYQPPPGPPPGWTGPTNTQQHQQQQYQPPPGPPPGSPPGWSESSSNKNSQQQPPPKYAPPPGPPPGWTDSKVDAGAAEPPPYHNWQEAVPDTSTLPPPPSFSQFASQTGNASEDDAERALVFVQSRPLWRPVPPPEAVYRSTAQGDIRPVRPAEFKGDLKVYGQGKWQGKSAKNCTDCVVISMIPLYYAMRDTPLETERPKTIYFEVKIRGLQQRSSRGDDCGLSIGFLAQPYPTWRSPGWERASVGVFSDDGGRFVNDPAGGKPFTEPFNVGDTVGLGMTFRLPDDYTTVTPKVKVFFTRNGRESGSWDLDEETDAEAGGTQGLEGDFDLYGAIGIFGGVEFEACFERSGWMWKG